MGEEGDGGGRHFTFKPDRPGKDLAGGLLWELQSSGHGPFLEPVLILNLTHSCLPSLSHTRLCVGVAFNTPLKLQFMVQPFWEKVRISLCCQSCCV